jgi:hypothetical protein
LPVRLIVRAGPPAAFYLYVKYSALLTRTATLSIKPEKKMKLNKENRFLLHNFFHPQVFFFIVTGICVIFMTFLTNDNAMEIAISGFASVFIGIGVNNFSSVETRKNDIQKFKNKIGHSLEMLQIVKSQIAMVNQDVRKAAYEHIGSELDELEKFMDLSIKVVGEEASDKTF